MARRGSQRKKCPAGCVPVEALRARALNLVEDLRRAGGPGGAPAYVGGLGVRDDSPYYPDMGPSDSPPEEDSGARSYPRGAKSVVVRDRYGNTHALELGGRDVRVAARSLATDLGFDDDEVFMFGSSTAEDPGWARLDPNVQWLGKMSIEGGQVGGMDGPRFDRAVHAHTNWEAFKRAHGGGTMRDFKRGHFLAAGDVIAQPEPPHLSEVNRLSLNRAEANKLLKKLREAGIKRPRMGYCVKAFGGEVCRHPKYKNVPGDTGYQAIRLPDGVLDGLGAMGAIPVVRIRLDRGGYDRQGRYWGAENSQVPPLWHTSAEELQSMFGQRDYARAHTKAEAQAIFAERIAQARRGR